MLDSIIPQMFAESRDDFGAADAHDQGINVVSDNRLGEFDHESSRGKGQLAFLAPNGAGRMFPGAKLCWHSFDDAGVSI